MVLVITFKCLLKHDHCLLPLPLSNSLVNLLESLSLLIVLDEYKVLDIAQIVGYNEPVITRKTQTGAVTKAVKWD